MKKALLWLMAAFYAGMGLLHLIKPTGYLVMVPSWLPVPQLFIYGSGLLEIGLAIGLIFQRTRQPAAQFVIGMLIVYLLLVHIPESWQFYQMADPALGGSVVRILIQFVLIGWAYWYVRPAQQGARFPVKPAN